MIYLELLRELEAAKVRYVIVGGLAVILHGFARLSMDIDLAISLDSENVNRFLGVAQRLGYRPKLPVVMNDFADPEKRIYWKTQKNMRVFSLFHRKRVQELVDVFVEEVVPFDDLYAHCVAMPVGDLLVKVASIPDLKKMKRMAGRPQDLQDIAALEDIEQGGHP